MVLFPGGRELFYPGGFRYPSCAWSIRAQMNETFHKQYLKKALPSLNFSLIIRHNARLEQVQASGVVSHGSVPDDGNSRISIR
jgi:hypothetical protein